MGNAGGNPAMDEHPIQGRVEILLVASCYRNRDKLRPDGSLGRNADFTPKFVFRLRRYIKHSRQCFLSGYPNTSNFVKNTPLRVIFSTLFSVFGYPDETLPSCLIYIVLKTLITNANRGKFGNAIW